MRGRECFEYWPELVLVLLILTVLVLDLALFEHLWPHGENGGATAVLRTR